MYGWERRRTSDDSGLAKMKRGVPGKRRDEFLEFLAEDLTREMTLEETSRTGISQIGRIEETFEEVMGVRVYTGRKDTVWLNEMV